LGITAEGTKRSEVSRGFSVRGGGVKVSKRKQNPGWNGVGEEEIKKKGASGSIQSGGDSCCSGAKLKVGGELQGVEEGEGS